MSTARMETNMAKIHVVTRVHVGPRAVEPGRWSALNGAILTVFIEVVLTAIIWGCHHRWF